MQLHELKPIHKFKKPKRIGRGGKKGSFSGRGQKGQKSRAGRRFKPVIRELIKKYPKLRGYRQKLNNRNLKLKTEVLNLEILEKKFKSGEIVNPGVLLERKLIHKIEGGAPEVKILGRGEIKKSLVIEGCRISKSAKEKIEKANGIIKLQPISEGGRGNPPVPLSRKTESEPEARKGARAEGEREGER